MNEIISSGYFLVHNGEKILLTGEEVISAKCPKCGKEHTVIFEDFLRIMKDGDLYGTSIWCSECSN